MEPYGMKIGSIELCDNCHHFKRIQFIILGKTTQLNLCSQNCLREIVNNTRFSENEHWLTVEWRIVEKEKEKKQ